MNRRILTIVLAVVLALGGTIAVYAYVKHADKRATAAAKPATVVVAAKHIPVGTTWSSASKDGYLKTETMPSDVVPGDALTSIGDQIQATDVVTTDIAAGQIVLRQMFGSKAPTTGPLKIPGSDMAVSVKVTADADVAGYVQPGSQVAIFDTFILLDGKGAVPAGSSSSSDKNDDWATKMLLSRVNVLAVSQPAPSGTQQSLAGSSGSNAATTTLLVTLAVDQDDATRLIHVAQTGRLYLALLTSDSDSTLGGGVDNHAKLGPVFTK